MDSIQGLRPDGPLVIDRVAVGLLISAFHGFMVFTPEGNRSSIVSFYTKKAPREIQKVLDAGHIKVSLPGSEANENETGMIRIRVAPAFFNNVGEVKRFLESL